MSMNHDNFSFHSSESIYCNLNMQPESTFELQNSIGDAPNDCNFTVVSYPVQPPVPLPLGGYEKFYPQLNTSSSAETQTSIVSHNLLNQEVSASGSSNSVGVKHRRSQRRYKSSGSSSSIYRGVTKYDNGRCEAFVWDNTDPDQKSKTTYVGGFEVEEDAAKAYDLAALKLWGKSASLNFSLSDYADDLEEMKTFTKKEYFLHIRRSKTGLAKTVSRYRGVTRNTHSKKWQVRLGKGKHLDSIYVGTFDTEEEAAEAYDVAAIRVKGPTAMTNLDKSNYNVQKILESPKLPIEKGVSKTLKRTSVDDVIQRRRIPRNVDSSCNPSFTPISPTSLHPMMFAPTPIDSSRYQFPVPPLQVSVPHAYQKFTFHANPSFTPQYGYGGSEPMKSTVQLQHVTHLMGNDFTSNHCYNGSSQQQHLEQTHSTQFVPDTQETDFVAELNDLANDSWMEKISNSQIPEVSFEMMGNSESSALGDGRNQVVRDLDDPGLDNSDLEHFSWLDKFLMS